MTRTTVALFAEPGTPAVARALVRCLARDVDVRAGSRLVASGPVPDAVLELGAAGAADVPAPWAELPRARFEAGPPPHLIASGTTVGIPVPWVIAEDLLAVPPLVRRRRRRRERLPADLVVELDDQTAGDADGKVTLLALAAAAVVRGRWLATALALGTPTVTAPGDAAAVGAEHARHALVVPAQPGATDGRSTGVEWQQQAFTAASSLARDEVLAARLSREAMGLRRRLDLGGTADQLLTALGLSGLGGEPMAEASTRITAALVALGAPPGTPGRSRALAAVAALDTTPDLTGG